VRRKRLSLFWLVVVVIVFAAVYALNTTASETTADAPDTPLTAQLAALPAANGEVPGYEREDFGSGWKDTDHNGCDSRNDVLARDLIAVTFKPGTQDCVVLTGTLTDPYTNTVIAFVRGNDTSDDVQIDHVVPLSWSWSHGAATWTNDQRIAFANDPRNLRAVDGPTNGSKSDSGPAEWMPPAAGYACTYVKDFLAVLVAFDLSIDDADRAAMRGTLATC
jgi:hypothetical protein